jgi:hypothetical protein
VNKSETSSSETFAIGVMLPDCTPAVDPGRRAIVDTNESHWVVSIRNENFIPADEQLTRR